MTSTGLRDREPIKMGGDIGQYHAGTIAAVAAPAAVTVAERSGRSHPHRRRRVRRPVRVDRPAHHLSAVPGLHRHGPAPQRWVPPSARSPPARSRLPTATCRSPPRRAGSHACSACSTTMRWPLDTPPATRSTTPSCRSRVRGGARLDDRRAPARKRWRTRRRRAGRSPRSTRRSRCWWTIPSGAAAASGRRRPRLVRHAVRQPGAPVRFHSGGWQLRRAAPTLGADRAVEIDAIADADAAAADSRDRAGAHCRSRASWCVDMTAAWAGPFATQLLGDLGRHGRAGRQPGHLPDEHPRRPAPADRRAAAAAWGRSSAAIPISTRDERPWNRCAVYLGHARGKRCVTLDPRTELGRPR